MFSFLIVYVACQAVGALREQYRFLMIQLYQKSNYLRFISTVTKRMHGLIEESNFKYNAGYAERYVMHCVRHKVVRTSINRSDTVCVFF
mmetsp:Transcript_46756/g.70629  ORF Transcript_46756/g.70629 Transcript_46756/m.70629 type:complete len:89 (-) Transcript_46756:1257-1523(-)